MKKYLGRNKLNNKAGLVILALVCFLATNSFEVGSKSRDKFSANDIIPKPYSVKELKGNVLLNSYTVIHCDPLLSAQAKYLSELIFNQCGLKLAVQSTGDRLEHAGSSVIHLRIDSFELNKSEMYKLKASEKVISIEAHDVEGVVHGIQSLMQLIPFKVSPTVLIGAVMILDYPRFSYRGMHLDVSRHFFSVDFIKKYIDYLAFYKFNNFHWHLTDDQGWRIEIKSYPKLTTIGAWRDSTLIGHFYKNQPQHFDGKRYGGFYTQEEIKAIIKYASVRGITIIPEIDIPGHCRAAIAAYPEFSTNPDTTWDVATAWGMYNRKNNVLAPTTATFKFLKQTFEEIADLFPSPYIHIGGDECSKIWWEADPKTQAFIKDHGLKNEVGLQNYFIKQVSEDLKMKGKKVIGWDEILEGELDQSSIIMNWHGVNAAIQAVQGGHPVIMSPSKPLYFDYYQTKNKDSLGSYGYNPLDAVYNYEPIPPKIDSLGLSRLILGAQGNVWTEYMKYPSKVEYMIFPRMTALSEALWTQPGKKDYTNFLLRLKKGAIPRYKYWRSSFFNGYTYWDSSR